MSTLVNGMMVKVPHQNAPSFVKCGISIKVEEFITFMKEHESNGWVNLDMKKSREGKLYVSLNEWKPEGQSQPQNNSGSFEDDIPF